MTCNCGKKKLEKEDLCELIDIMCDRTDKVMTGLANRIERYDYCGEQWPTILINFVGKLSASILSDLIMRSPADVLAEDHVKMLLLTISHHCKAELTKMPDSTSKSTKVH